MNVKLRAGQESEPSARSDSSELSASLQHTHSHTHIAAAWLGGPETGTFGEDSSGCCAKFSNRFVRFLALVLSCRHLFIQSVSQSCFFSLLSFPRAVRVLFQKTCVRCVLGCVERCAHGLRLRARQWQVVVIWHVRSSLLAQSAAVSGSERRRRRGEGSPRTHRRRARHTETLGGWTGALSLV